MDQHTLKELEDTCIQECAPPCSAGCPVHVDVRSLNALIAEGDFSAALKCLLKKIPFPGIIGRICDQSCRSACNRSASGGALSIAALERACADFGDNRMKAGHRPRRNKKVSVIGSGLSGLTTAVDLAKKGYEVTLFEKNTVLGGKLRAFTPEVLPPDIIDRELSILSELNITVRLNEKVTARSGLKSLLGSCDAVYIGTGTGSESDFPNLLTGNMHPAEEICTYMTSTPGIFAGGSLLYGYRPYPPIHSVADGRHAATSLDRYLQGASLTASRSQEGVYTSRLYTNLEQVAPCTLVTVDDPAAGYSREEALQEAQHCLQCQCLECVKVCSYLKQHGSYPKKYVREIYNNLSIVMGARKSNKLINSCSLCGLCAEVCPNRLNMEEVCSTARRTMVDQNRMPPSAHDFPLQDMHFSNGAQCELSRHAPGTNKSDYIFFPGCQLSASAPEHVEKTYALLRTTFSENTGLMLRCCGAPADWAGRDDLLSNARDDFNRRYSELGRPPLIVACPSCQRMLSSHFPDVKTISLWEVLASDSIQLAQKKSASSTVALHDSCATRHDSALHENVRSIVTDLGYTVQELPLNREKTECCGYGGLMWFVDPGLSTTVIDNRIKQAPEEYVTYCSVCRDFFASRGKRALHMLDLLFEEDRDSRASRRAPGSSLRQKNRRQLKTRLLINLWGENAADPKSTINIRLSITPETQEILDQRYILDQDIRDVIEYAEKTGRKFTNPDTGRFLAYRKLKRITCWVEYACRNAEYVIYNAYSHRMEIVEENHDQQE